MHILKNIKTSSLVSGTASYLSVNVLNASIPFLLLPILTRYLEPSAYGEIAVFQVWVSLLGALCGLGVIGAANRKYFDYDEPDKRIGYFITACLTLLIASTSLVFVIVLPISSWLSSTLGLSKTWLLIGVPLVCFDFMIKLRLGQWQMRGRPKIYGIFMVSKSLINMSLSLTLVVLLSLGVVGRLSGYAVAIGIFGLLAIFSLYRDGLLRKSWRPDLMEEALRFGVPLVPHIAGGFLLLTIDRAAISMKLGLESAGYYMVAAQLGMVIGLVLDSVNKAYVPWLYEKLKRNIEIEKKLIVKLTYGYYIFLICFSGLAFLVGGDILIFMAGEKYSPAATLIGWLVLAKALQGMYLMVTCYVFYAKKTGTIAKITIASGMLNVGLLYYLMDCYGLIGAAWAMCISMLFQWIVTWLAASRLIDMPWAFWRLT